MTNVLINATVESAAIINSEATCKFHLGRPVHIASWSIDQTQVRYWFAEYLMSWRSRGGGGVFCPRLSDLMRALSTGEWINLRI